MHERFRGSVITVVVAAAALGREDAAVRGLQLHVRRVDARHVGRDHRQRRFLTRPPGLPRLIGTRIGPQMNGVNVVRSLGYFQSLRCCREPQPPRFDSVQLPAMRGGSRDQLLSGFRKRDVQTLFASSKSFYQVLQSERGLTRAGIAIDQVKPVRNQPTLQNVIEPGNPRSAARHVRFGPVVHERLCQ